jgi:hypothetical protein
MIEHIKQLFGISGTERQRHQIAESRERVADNQSNLLREACAENVQETDHLAKWAREMAQQETRQ